MMIFTSIYGVVDGFFVSNYAGKTPFAAVNFVMPYLMILGTLGFMIGAGGSALISKTMGEGDREKANKLFSLFVYVTAISGAVISVLGIIFLRPVVALLGADGAMLEDCVTYGTIILIALPFFMLQLEFQSFFITAERPKLGLVTTLIAGCTNMVLDALFLAVFNWGLVGAAVATAVSQLLGAVIPLAYFSVSRNSILRLGKTRFFGKELLKACANGSSELMSNVSFSLVNMLYNAQLMAYAGDNGIAAYGVMMYVNMIFIAVFIGYSTGVAPVIGFHYGAENRDELKSLRKKSTALIIAFSVMMLVFGELLARPLSEIFVGYDASLLEITVRGFSIFSLSFLFSGIAIFGSSFFTALNNGLVSAIISFLRTLVFQVAAVLLLPLIWGLDGIWISIVVAEVVAMIVTVAFIVGCRKRYGY